MKLTVELVDACITALASPGAVGLGTWTRFAVARVTDELCTFVNFEVMHL